MKVRQEIQELLNEYGIDYCEIVDDEAVFIYDDSEYIIYPDNSWKETGTSNHSGYDVRFEGHPLDELRSYFDWFEEARWWCERYGITEKGAYHKIAHIIKQF